ncbi:uncharacterized protein LOC129092562 [Anoplopoma fimbria]|uniref:uncharacterized protein LOC129092562 n=1 Tax=Anoplopoma fimbria TaxID=229290 RepID=UPI0023EBB203|nr:uncharacterized protein LOC129092562 [Anoplopoma fimbria]
MSDPEIPHQPLLEAPSQQAQSGRSSRAYKVAGITLLACVLVVGQAMTAYLVFSQRNDIKSLQDQSDNLESELTKGRSVSVPMRMPINALPKLMDVTLDEEASTEVPDKVPQQATVCQLEAAGVKPVQVPGFYPACDERGLYRAQQCFMDRCWCVNPANGQQLPGTMKTGPASCSTSVRTAAMKLTLPNVA